MVFPVRQGLCFRDGAPEKVSHPITTTALDPRLAYSSGDRRVLARPLSHILRQEALMKARNMTQVPQHHQAWGDALSVSVSMRVCARACVHWGPSCPQPQELVPASPPQITGCREWNRKMRWLTALNRLPPTQRIIFKQNKSKFICCLSNKPLGRIHV